MNSWKISTFVATGLLGAVLGYQTIRPAQAEAQPRMHAALSSLEMAKAQLEAATPDKGGHRAKAIQATREAIEETKKGIEFDNTHDNDKKK